MYFFRICLFSNDDKVEDRVQNPPKRPSTTILCAICRVISFYITTDYVFGWMDERSQQVYYILSYIAPILNKMRPLLLFHNNPHRTKHTLSVQGWASFFLYLIPLIQRSLCFVDWPKNSLTNSLLQFFCNASLSGQYKMQIRGSQIWAV